MSHFETFWTRYPNKTGRKDAEKKWKDKKLDDQWDRISKFLDWAPKHDDRWKKGFIPMGSTFVNQERWNDHDKHMRPTLSSAPINQVPDLNKVVEWIKNNKPLTEHQLTSGWKWIYNEQAQRVVGVIIPDMQPLMFKSVTQQTLTG